MDSIPSRYALALFKIAKEKGQLLSFLEVCQNALPLFDRNSSIINFLSNEFFSSQQKIQLIDNVFPDKDYLFFGNFIKIVLNKHRTTLLHTIIKEAIELIQKELNQQNGFVYSVNPLTQDQLLKLEEALRVHLGTPISLQNRINKSLIGGFLVDIQGKVFDASMIEKLNNLRQRLLKRG